MRGKIRESGRPLVRNHYLDRDEHPLGGNPLPASHGAHHRRRSGTYMLLRCL